MPIVKLPGAILRSRRPVLALLIRCGVLQSDRAAALRRVGIEWAPIRGVEIRIRRGP